MNIQECGTLNAFSCVEFEKVLFEFEKAQKWKESCADIVKPPPGEENSLPSALTQVTQIDCIIHPID